MSDGVFRWLYSGVSQAAGGAVGGARARARASTAPFAFWRAGWADLNYIQLYLPHRLDAAGLPRERVDALLAPPASEPGWAARRDALLAHDQLRAQMASGEAFADFAEAAPITFRPTYKFDKLRQRDAYDLSEKRRIPAYTDRVLRRSRGVGGITCVRYDSCEALSTSDHRPVLAEFTVQCAVDAALLQAVLSANGVAWPPE